MADSAYDSGSILGRMLAGTDGGYNTDPGDLIYDVQKPVADELAAFHEQMAVCNDRHFADTATGEDLDSYVRQFGLTRKEATFAAGEVTFYGDEGAAINIGDMVTDESGILFYVTEEGVIGADGECTVPVICATPTAAGNIAAGKINKIPVTLRGITAVSNAEATGGGSTRETDEELRNRFYESRRYSSVPGCKTWYEAEAMSVEGVGDAKCIPTWNGGGTVKIIVLNSDKETADEALLERVRAHFADPIVGATITVVTAERLEINISAKVTLLAGYTAEQIQEAFLPLITSLLKNIGYDGGTVYVHRVGALLLSVEGVRDYDNLKINGQDANIIINAADNYIPVAGVITIG